MNDKITKEDVLSWVKSFVWCGEYDEEEVGLLIDDQLGLDDDFDEDWLRDVIRTEVAAKQKAEETWLKVTDFDRLDRAFKNLQEQGIFALHRAGFTQSDGLEEVQDLYDDEGGENSDYAGHCFYTEQDQEGAIDGYGLFIGFGHLTGSDAKGVEVGHLLRTALQREEFEIQWDETIHSRLFVKGFRWQRRSPWKKI